VALSVRLLAVAGQEISPARKHIACHVIHINVDAVRFFIDRVKQICLVDLFEGALRKFLIVAK
jgi:hypothetical protein